MRWSALALASALLVVGCGTTLQSSRLAPVAAPGEVAGQGRGSPGTTGVANEQGPGAVPVARAGLSGAISASSGATTDRSGLPTTGQQSASVSASLPPAAGPSRDPLQVGVLYSVNDGAQSAGINNGNTFSLKQVVQAFVDSYNTMGGIGGRRIVPVYAELHSASSDYESQIQAACASFTQDHHVAVVLSIVGYYSENLLACLSKAAVPMISGDWTAPDAHDASQYPLYLTPTTLVGETQEAAIVDHLAASGWLQARNRIGVVIEDCPVDRRTYQNGLAPALRHASLTVAWTFNPRCFQSIQDYGAQTSQMSNAVLQFRQHGVDRVMVVSQGAEANLVFAFSTVADQQRWYPGYALSSTALPAGLALNASATQLDNMRGVGWLPVIDTENLSQAPPTTTGQRCLDQMKRAGFRPTSNTDLINIYGPCDAFGFYDAILRATNGDASARAVVQATNGVGGTYVSALTVGGKLTTAGGRVRAADGRLFAFVAGKQFEYTSAPFPL